MHKSSSKTFVQLPKEDRIILPKHESKNVLFADVKSAECVFKISLGNQYRGIYALQMDICKAFFKENEFNQNTMAASNTIMLLFASISTRVQGPINVE